MNDKNDKYIIPQHLDEPFKLILWTADELAAFFMPFLFLLLFFGSPVSGFVVGCVLMMVLKKIKGEQGHFFIYNLMYWYLPTIVKLKKTPPSYIREWQG